MATVGLIINPAAGRDIRRLTGGASVVDNYAKRRIGECVLAGLTIVEDPPDVEVMPDRAGVAGAVVAAAPEGGTVEEAEMAVEASAADTRHAATYFRKHADVVVVLGGDGTTRDAALELGDVPLIAVSTGTNNVVPTPVDGTVAGAAAAVVATGSVDVDAVTDRHGRIDARVDDRNGETHLTGLAAVELTNRPFVGTRAVVDPSELLGGVVSRAHPADIGLGSIAGCIEPMAPGSPGGAALRLDEPDTAPRTVRAIIAPGMTTAVGVSEHERLQSGESATFEVTDGVVGADGERELELVDATVVMTPTLGGPRLVDVDAALEEAAVAGVLNGTPFEEQ